jgi:hypothetical protein
MSDLFGIQRHLRKVASSPPVTPAAVVKREAVALAAAPVAKGVMNEFKATFMPRYQKLLEKGDWDSLSKAGWILDILKSHLEEHGVVAKASVEGLESDLDALVALHRRLVEQGTKESLYAAGNLAESARRLFD